MNILDENHIINQAYKISKEVIHIITTVEMEDICNKEIKEK